MPVEVLKSMLLDSDGETLVLMPLPKRGVL
jgi:hypothetical protein